MPIRINLLAEEQAAEEMRKRDPIKRALFAGGAIAVLMVGWIAITQFSVSAARAELTGLGASLKKIEDSSKLVKSNQLAAAEMHGRLGSLDRYGRERFLSGSLLDAVQRAAVDKVRLMEIRVEQKHTVGDAMKFFTTNVPVPFNPPAAWWKFWAGDAKSPAIETAAGSSLAGITNKAPFTTNLLAYSVKIVPAATNEADKTISAKVDFTTVPWAKEVTVIEVRGRDYGSPPGAAIDEFARRINGSDYFKALLEPESGFQFTERPPQARPDPSDALNPNAQFVPFTIQLAFKNRILANE